MTQGQVPFGHTSFVAQPVAQQRQWPTGPCFRAPQPTPPAPVPSRGPVPRPRVGNQLAAGSDATDFLMRLMWVPRSLTEGSRSPRCRFRVAVNGHDVRMVENTDALMRLAERLAAHSTAAKGLTKAGAPTPRWAFCGWKGVRAQTSRSCPATASAAKPT